MTQIQLDHPRASADAPAFFGRRVVWAAFVLAAFGWGVGFYGPPVYLHAVVLRTGWSLPFVSAAVTLHFLVGAAAVANLPRMHRRLGVAATTGAGAVLLALGVVGWATAGRPWLLLAAALFSGVGWVAMGAAAVNAIVAPWFVRTRPRALATAYNGASIGGVVFSPLWVALIGLVGFTAAAAGIGLAMVAVVLVLAFRVFAWTPDRLGQAPDGDAPSAGVPAAAARRVPVLPGRLLWRDRAFLTLASGMALGLFAQIGLVAHLFSVLVPALGPGGAGAAMGLATGCAIAGRTVVGRLMPVDADRRRIACASYAVQVAGSLVGLAAGGDAVLLLAGVVLFGCGIGNATSLPPLVAQVEFTREDALRVVPLIVAIGQGTYAFAPAAFGLVRETLADPAMFALAALVQVAAIGCFLAGRR
ncbi:MAG: MFS transporter [Alphaproteobacteria bacterium]|nr:MFS transporter [Alphaproteobacteria bacterium]